MPHAPRQVGKEQAPALVEPKSCHLQEERKAAEAKRKQEEDRRQAEEAKAKMEADKRKAEAAEQERKAAEAKRKVEQEAASLAAARKLQEEMQQQHEKQSVISALGTKGMPSGGASGVGPVCSRNHTPCVEIVAWVSGT